MKKSILFLILISSVCFGQVEKSVKTDSSFIKNLNSIGLGIMNKHQTLENFMPDFNENTDVLVARIEKELYMISPKNLLPLIRNVAWMNSTPPWNAYITYFKNGRAVYTNAQYVLNIDTKNLDPKIFTKINHHKEIIDNEEDYLKRLKSIKETNYVSAVYQNTHSFNNYNYYSCFFVEHPTNQYFLYFNVYVPLTLNKKTEMDVLLEDYRPDIDCNKNDWKEKFELNIKHKTITFNRCEYYIKGYNIDKDVIALSGYTPDNETQYLLPIKVYCNLTIDDCQSKFDAKAMQLFYGKPLAIYKGEEKKNDEYILEWYDWKK